MTEVEWLASNDPRPMLDFLRGKVSDRKLRLFAVACCWRAETSLPCGATSHRAVGLAERYADKLVTADQLDQAARNVELQCHLYPGEPVYDPSWWACQRLMEPGIDRCSWYAAYWTVFADTRDRNQKIELVEASEGPPQAGVLRDIFGLLLFRSTLLPCTWRPSTVVRLAQAIYEDRAFDRLPILADALEEAGCTEAAILEHCRGPGPHVRGCWVVDLLLGKE